MDQEKATACSVLQVLSMYSYTWQIMLSLSSKIQLLQVRNRYPENNILMYYLFFTVLYNTVNGILK